MGGGGGGFGFGFGVKHVWLFGERRWVRGRGCVSLDEWEMEVLLTGSLDIEGGLW